MSQDDLDFIATLSREFCYALDGLVAPDFLNPQECYSAVADLIEPLSVDSLRALTEADFERLAARMNDNFEISTIEVSHLRSAVEQIVWHHSS